MSHLYQIVTGDLLQANEDLILQQNNCLSIKAVGLSKTIADAYPYADPYSIRTPIHGRYIAIEEDRPTPGTIRVFPSPSNDGRTFVSLFSQYGTGRPNVLDPVKADNPFTDTMDDRCHWFSSCLEQVAVLQPRSIAMPFKIGCGMAGGDWNRYSNIINMWTCAHPDTRVVLYKLDSGSDSDSSDLSSEDDDSGPCCAVGF